MQGLKIQALLPYSVCKDYSYDATSGRRGDYSLCTVTSVVQCTRPQLEGQTILLHLLMITLSAVLYTS